MNTAKSGDPEQPSDMALELARIVALLAEAQVTNKRIEGDLIEEREKRLQAEAARDAYKEAISAGRQAQLDPRVLRALVSMTPKQHAVLLLVLSGASNETISKVFELSPANRKQLERLLPAGEHYMPMSVSTVKGMVRAVGKHLGLDDGRMTRAEIISLAKSTVDAMPAEDYKRVALVPKGWATFREPDDHLRHPFLYSTRRDRRK